MRDEKLIEEQLEFYKRWKKELEEQVYKLRQEKEEIQKEKSELIWMLDIYKKSRVSYNSFSQEIEELDDNIYKIVTDNKEDDIDTEIKKLNYLIKTLNQLLE